MRIRAFTHGQVLLAQMSRVAADHLDPQEIIAALRR